MGAPKNFTTMPDPSPLNFKQENANLLRQYQQTPSLRVRNRLVELNLGLVKKEARYWVNQCRENYEDLLQIGCLGLISAIERFDCGKGCSFSTFAVPYIQGEIQHYLRDQSTALKIPRKWLTLHSAANKIRREWQKLNRQPTEREIAEALSIELSRWQEIKLGIVNRSPISLDLPISNQEDIATPLGELVIDRRYHSFQLAQEDEIRLQQALSNLEHRTRKILESIFFRGLSRKEAAELLGVSTITVNRQVKKGVLLLQTVMKES